MLNILGNYSYIIILPVFALLFTVIWNALNRYSSFSGAVSMVIAVCVSMLCVISILGGSLPENGSPQEPTPVFQKDISPQEPPQYRFNSILLPYMALMMSFLLLLMLVKIGLLADGENSNSRKSRRDWDIRKQLDKRKRYLR